MVGAGVTAKKRSILDLLNDPSVAKYMVLPLVPCVLYVAQTDPPELCVDHGATRIAVPLTAELAATLLESFGVK